MCLGLTLMRNKSLQVTFEIQDSKLSDLVVPKCYQIKATYGSFQYTMTRTGWHLFEVNDSLIFWNTAVLETETGLPVRGEPTPLCMRRGFRRVFVHGVNGSTLDRSGRIAFSIWLGLHSELGPEHWLQWLAVVIESAEADQKWHWGIERQVNGSPDRYDKRGI